MGEEGPERLHHEVEPCGGAGGARCRPDPGQRLPGRGLGLAAPPGGCLRQCQAPALPPDQLLRGHVGVCGCGSRGVTHGSPGGSLAGYRTGHGPTREHGRQLAVASGPYSLSNWGHCTSQTAGQSCPEEGPWHAASAASRTATARGSQRPVKGGRGGGRAQGPAGGTRRAGPRARPAPRCWVPQGWPPGGPSAASPAWARGCSTVPRCSPVPKAMVAGPAASPSGQGLLPC